MAKTLYAATGYGPVETQPVAGTYKGLGFPPMVTSPQVVTTTTNPPKADEVKHPEHYTSHPSGVECMDVIRHYPVEIAFAMKYLWRWDKKGDPLLNIRKAIQCLEMFIAYKESEAK